MVCFFLGLLKLKLTQWCLKRGGGVKATFGQCPKGSSFFFRITSLSKKVKQGDREGLLPGGLACHQPQNTSHTIYCISLRQTIHLPRLIVLEFWGKPGLHIYRCIYRIRCDIVQSQTTWDNCISQETSGILPGRESK